MFRSIRFVGLLILAVTASLPACGTDAPSAFQTAPFTSGLTKTESLGDLNDADVATLCSSLGMYIAHDADFTEARCRVVGFEAAATASFAGHPTDDVLRSACSDAEDACARAKADPAPSSCSKPNSACTATVAELEACVADFVEAAKTTFLKLPPCALLDGSSFDIDESETPPTEMKQPASCQTLEAKCPGATTSTGLDSGNEGGS
ncbi:MAG TPA: hypothetical protein VHC69_30580 [Polyangiaceae bacterium]|nr:hypothetical protein [Polyangiaceae bacterium]